MKPNRIRIRPLCVILFTLILALAFGCANKEEKKEKHQKRAKEYIEKQEYKKAVIELKNVIQLDPKDDAAYYELGETYLKLKQGREAIRSFVRAVSINPNNLKAQLKIGQFFFLGKRTEEAREKADLILEKSPDNIEALNLLSGIQIQEDDMDSAQKTLEKAVSIDPNHFDTHLSLARLLLLKADLNKSEKAYLKTISLNPESRIPYIELSRLYATMGQMNKAESALKKMIQASGARYQNLQVLARFYETTRKWGQAEKTYLESVNSAPEEDVEPLMNLGGYYTRRKLYDKALEAMQWAAAVKEDDSNILVSIAQLHLDFKQMKDAEATVDKILAKDRGHVSANLLKGRLYLLKKDFANALERFDLVVRERPRSDMAHYFRALCRLGKRERKLAQKDLLKAVELNPRLVDARLLLAEFYLRVRDQDHARQQIESALKHNPRSVRALMLQGNLKILERDAKGAEAAFKKAVELYPDYAPAYVRLGLIYSLTMRRRDALESLEKALQLNPLQFDALSLIASIQVREKKYDEAIQICEKQKQKIGQNPADRAFIEDLEGKIYLAKEDLAKARRHFEKAIEADPNRLSPYLALARIYVREEKLDGAISKLEAILSNNPNYLVGHMALGAIYDQEGDPEKAEAYYRRALDIKGDFGPAANNLAWNLAEKGGNIDEALGFAQIAKEQMPKSAAVMDTLGWIYYLKGIYLNAISELQDSVEIAPNNPVINYHLGLAYYKNKQPDAAREFLEKALEIDQNFKGAEGARSLLKGIKASASK